MTIFFTTQLMFLEEAEANAVKSDRAFIDHGKIIDMGTAAQLMKKTDSKTLEQAYLKMTGKKVRDEEADPHSAWKERNRARAMR